MELLCMKREKGRNVRLGFKKEGEKESRRKFLPLLLLKCTFPCPIP